MRFLVPAVLLAFSLPLVARMVPPNRLYGFRTSTALSSEQAWYSANAIAGWIFAGASIVWLLWLLVAPKLAWGQRLDQYVGPGLLIAALIVSLWATRNVAT